MKSLFNKYIWLQLILSILLLFGGVIIIIFSIANKVALTDALNITTAVILFLFGGFSILATLIFETKKVLTNGILYGSACIALGVFLLTKELILLQFIVLLLAIFFIVVSVIELGKAVLLTLKFKENLFAIIFSYVVAALFITAGVLALIFRKEEQTEIIFCIIGGALLFLAGVYELIIGVKTMIELNKNKGDKKEDKRLAKRGKKQKEENAPQEKPFDETVEYEAPQELDYTEEVPAIEEKKEEPKQEVVDNQEQPKE